MAWGACVGGSAHTPWFIRSEEEPFANVARKSLINAGIATGVAGGVFPENLNKD
jgi:hypothetical protein